MWFSVDSCGDVELHERPKEARERAEEALQAERDLACEGWSEDVTNIIWGKVYAQATETLRRPYDPEVDHLVPEFDEIVDYDVVYVPGMSRP